MRVGIYLPRLLRPFSIDFEAHAREILAAGHEPVMICRGVEMEFPGEVVVCDGTVEDSPEFWKGLGLDRVIFFTWLHQPQTLRASREAGIYNLTRADSDGMISARVFPKAKFRQLVDPAHAPLDWAKRFRHFLNWYCFHWRQSDREVLEVLDLSNRVVIETEPAAENLRKFLGYHRRKDLAEKIAIVPHAVPDLFLQGPIGEGSRENIFCGGRWEDDQKDARLLAAAIPQILREHPQGQILLAGSGVEKAFGHLAALHSQVRLLGWVDRAELPGLLGSCAFLLSSSRWESHPIGALEALCCGCTCVATPVPGFADIIGSQDFGTLAADHTPESLARAVREERQLWAAGKREPCKIASHWREQVSHKRVINQLLTL